jgi:hypothetical protein
MARSHHRGAVKARSLLEGSIHTPGTFAVIGKTYDDAWVEIAHRFNGDVQKTRLRLAHAVLAVALDNGQSAETLKNAALKVTALAHGDQRDSK